MGSLSVVLWNLRPVIVGLESCQESKIWQLRTLLDMKSRLSISAPITPESVHAPCCHGEDDHSKKRSINTAVLRQGLGTFLERNFCSQPLQG